MYIKHPSLNSPDDPQNPPRCIVDFITHIQVSLDATYISHTPNQDAPDTASTLAPPRSSSMPKGRPPSLHPSIFPPNTPIPIPSTTESDRKYVQSEGTPLFSSIWGTKRTTEESREKFALLFSEAEASWVAVYELSLIVCESRHAVLVVGTAVLTFLAYLRLSVPDPLLCLTASVTLRDKALSLSQSTHPLVACLVKMGMISHPDSGDAAAGEGSDKDEETQDTGFEEINLLEGLTLGASMRHDCVAYGHLVCFTVGSSISSDTEPLHLPSTRLGNTTRQRYFSLPPVSAPSRTPPSTSRQGLHHILRKSYRKILQAVSGFRVRMRTVFIPHVLLPKDSSASENDRDAYDDEFENGNEEREAGNSERTVVLCVEVENSGESGPATGFSLERLDVKIGGEGATARLIGWGEGAFDSDIESYLFPLRIGSMEQYNLLYIVSFWSTPNDQENLLLAGQSTHGGGELQRAVTITVYGRPYLTSEVKDENDNVLCYPTQTFSSRWNCILDLSSRPLEEPVDETAIVGHSALPEPPSPFPGRATLSSLLSSSVHTKPTPQAIAGKRHTLPGSMTAARAINPSNLRLSLPQREHSGGPAVPPATARSFTPPSVALQAFNRSVPTMLSTPPSKGGGSYGHADSSQLETFVSTPTPAYPAFPPGTTASTPHAQALRGHQGYSGPSIEIKRERGAGMTTAVPQTPFPTVLSTQFDRRHEPLPSPSGEPVVISVGLLPTEPGDEHLVGQRKLYPSDQFTLDIFVYNQSSWTRRFEVSYPNVDRRQRKTEQNKVIPGSRGKSNLKGLKASIAPPGILPLENRVRVG